MRNRELKHRFKICNDQTFSEEQDMHKLDECTLNNQSNESKFWSE